MFSAWDLECKEFFNVGLNSETRYECVLEIWKYMTEDWEDENIEQTTIADVLCYSNVDIIQHENKIKDLYKKVGQEADYET